MESGFITPIHYEKNFVMLHCCCVASLASCRRCEIFIKPVTISSSFSFEEAKRCKSATTFMASAIDWMNSRLVRCLLLPGHYLLLRSLLKLARLPRRHKEKVLRRVPASHLCVYLLMLELLHYRYIALSIPSKLNFPNSSNNAVLGNLCSQMDGKIHTCENTSWGTSSQACFTYCLQHVNCIHDFCGGGSTVNM